MPTLIKKRGRGRGVRRCDERCYMDAGDKCQCLCGGINHGVGLRRALLNTAEIAKKHIHDSAPSLFHSFTKEILDRAMNDPTIIKPLVILTRGQSYKKGGK